VFVAFVALGGTLGPYASRAKVGWLVVAAALASSGRPSSAGCRLSN